MDKKNHRLDDYFLKYYELVTRNAYWYLRDYYAAEDICQETFIRFSKHMDDIPPEKVKTWLLAVSGRLALDYKKKGGKYKTIVGLPLVEEVPEDTYTDLSLLLVRREEEEKGIRVLKRLAREKPRWYEAVLMSYLEEMDNPSIGKILGVRAQVICMWKNRAIKWLRDAYRIEEAERDR
ncbi:MAG: sigma-70 family RNA polymerase sigma factor [Clostridiales bacterium]|nr:sigma-70 family RNA polymerase sigma factor [Clostridiales bacterium]